MDDTDSCPRGISIPRQLSHIRLNLNQTTQLVLPSDENEMTSPKLSEPRHLFSLQRELGPQQAPRWPAECQMIEEAPRHNSKCPSEREPYYQATGSEPEPPPWGEEILNNGGQLVYSYVPQHSVPYFTRSSTANIHKESEESHQPAAAPDELIFESRFESGNLAKVFRITGNFYELHLRPDLYTARHFQWYYFSITNMQINTTYRFSIVNFAKTDSLYRDGLKPLMYSNKEAEINGIGWQRCGSRIVYFRNEPVKETSYPTHTLSFTLEFPHEDDTVYLAYCYPYTYSLLQDTLLQIQNDEERSQYCKIRLLCRSLAGNSIHVLTVTSPDIADSGKSGIVLTARVHPGETPSSWIMHGVLDFLTGPSASAHKLREKFIFKIVPMLNPDGVIVGNTRCSLAARDLNRQYRVVSRECFPSVWHVKMLIRKLIEERPVLFYCDFHSHSRKHNIFIYGCEDKDANEFPLMEQVFPLMMHSASRGKFDFENCKFVVQRAKEGTGRVVMKQLGVQHSYTLEASVCGALTGSDSTHIQTHFNIQDYEEMGHVFCETLFEFLSPTSTQSCWMERALRCLATVGSTAEEPIFVHVPNNDSAEEEIIKRNRHFSSRRFSLLVGPSQRKTDFLQVARCISQLNVQMSRLSCGTRSRSNSYSTSSSHSPTPMLQFSGPISSNSVSISPSIANSSRTGFKSKQSARSPKVLARSLTMPSASNKSPGFNATKMKSKCVKRSTNVKSEELTVDAAAPSGGGGAAAAAAAVSSVKRSELSRRGPRKSWNELPKAIKQKNVPVQTVSSDSSKLNPDTDTFDNRQPKKDGTVLSHTRKTPFPKRKNRMKQIIKDQGLASEKLIERVETYNRVLSAMKNDFA